MSKTIREITITGKQPDEIRVHVTEWLMKNGFRVNEWYSKGRLINLRGSFSLLGAFIKPQKGAIVASQIDLSGCLVFEISLNKDKKGTVLHGEFYAVGLEIFTGLKMDLKPESGLFWKYARDDGYKLMEDLLETIQNC